MNQEEREQYALAVWTQKVAHLIAAAEEGGVIITVERTPLEPLAMGNHVALVEGRLKR